MRTPVVLVGGQGDSDRVAGTLMATPGTAVVGHEYDGQVVRRWVSIMRDGELSTSEWPLELTDGCICCTTRNDLLILLRRLHRRDDVTRIVVLLAPWSEPEPLCVAISDEPALRDVRIDAVLTTVDPGNWLNLAVGADELDDGRTVAQVVVGQAEFADVLVLSQPDATTLSILRRLAPLARITVGVDRVEQALAHLDPHTRRGRRRDPHDPLLAGQPPLDPAGEITLMEFTARRPFHPERLHAAIDMLLDGVVRTRGRVFVANRLDDIMWIESAGGGVLIENAGNGWRQWDPTSRPAPTLRAAPWRRRGGMTDSATGTYPWRCWSAVPGQPRSTVPCGARYSLITNWPGPVNGRITPIRSGIGTPIPARSCPTSEMSSPFEPTTAEKMDDETGCPPRLPPRRVQGRQQRKGVPDPIDDHQLTDHRLGNPGWYPHLPAGPLPAWAIDRTHCPRKGTRVRGVRALRRGPPRRLRTMVQRHFLAEHSAQTPKISIVWLASENPFSRATSAAHASTLVPCTSTVAPHCRHTRW